MKMKRDERAAASKGTTAMNADRDGNDDVSTLKKEEERNTRPTEQTDADDAGYRGKVSYEERKVGKGIVGDNTGQ
ncbi:unnamed protein product [Linum trigynum]|uniref:Uncharacterized protein n=1 Tax=Linum trigynum TaxID=586398 RepID=A0AAV2DM55_9ROSI